MGRQAGCAGKGPGPPAHLGHGEEAWVHPPGLPGGGASRSAGAQLRYQPGTQAPGCGCWPEPASSQEDRAWSLARKGQRHSPGAEGRAATHPGTAPGPGTWAESPSTAASATDRRRRSGHGRCSVDPRHAIFHTDTRENASFAFCRAQSLHDREVLIRQLLHCGLRAGDDAGTGHPQGSSEDTVSRCPLGKALSTGARAVPPPGARQLPLCTLVLDTLADGTWKPWAEAGPAPQPPPHSPGL